MTVLVFFVGTKTEFIAWLNKFNALRKEITIDEWTCGNDINFMDLYIYKSEAFFKRGKFDISTCQKPSNKYMYLPLGQAMPNM